MIKPEIFDMRVLIDRLVGHDDNEDPETNWRLQAEIIPCYVPPYPRPGERARTVVKFCNWFLRHSKGPRQGHFWDTYGDDYQEPELALIALMQAPPPPSFTYRNRIREVIDEYRRTQETTVSQSSPKES